MPELSPGQLLMTCTMLERKLQKLHYSLYHYTAINDFSLERVCFLVCFNFIMQNVVRLNLQEGTKTLWAFFLVAAYFTSHAILLTMLLCSLLLLDTK